MSVQCEVYLAGAIDKAPDGGTGWRLDITPKLEKLGWKVFNPCVYTDGKIAQRLGWGEFDKDRFRKFRKESRDLSKVVAEWVVDQDLGAVKRCNVLLVYFDEYVMQGAGTYGEMTLARDARMPVYIVLSSSLKYEDIPFWVLGCATKIFNNFEEALLYFSFLKI